MASFEIVVPKVFIMFSAILFSEEAVNIIPKFPVVLLLSGHNRQV